MRVVLTRERGQNDEIRSWLPEGVVVDEVPLTSTNYVDLGEVRRALTALEEFGSFRALVVTSARSARYGPAATEALAPGAAVLCVGIATSGALRAEGVEVDVIGTRGATQLAPSIRSGPVLLLGAATTREELSVTLRARGEVARHVACYSTLSVRLTRADEDRLRAADVVIVGAPSAWAVAKDVIDAAALVVVPGATTAEVVRRDHERVLVGWGPALHEHLRAP